MSLTGFLAQFPPWLRRGRPFWVAIALPLVVIALAIVPWGDAEVRIRYSGLLLELAGVVTVAYGLRDTRKRFGKPSFLATWWADRPRWRRNVQMMVGTGSFAMRGGRARLHGTFRPSPDAPLEQRVAMLESTIVSLHTTVQANRHHVDDELEKRSTEQEKERAEREQEDASIRQLIDEAVAGGLTVEATGLSWLVVGVILATASQEIGRLLN